MDPIFYITYGEWGGVFGVNFVDPIFYNILSGWGGGGTGGVLGVWR